MFSEEDISQKRREIELYLQGPLLVTDLTQLQNILYIRALKGPQQFWQSLGDIFKVCIILEPDELSENRQLCSIMRFLALQLFKKWKKECSTSYELYIKECRDLSIAKKEALGFSSDRGAQLDPGSIVPNRLSSDQTLQAFQRSSVNDSNQLFQRSSVNDSNQQQLQQQMQLPCSLQELHIMQGILHQNERVLDIEKQLLREDNQSDQSNSVQMIDLFLNNQSLLEELLHMVKKEHNSFKSFQQDVSIIKRQQLAQQNKDLVKLRNDLLGKTVRQLQSFNEKCLARQGISSGSLDSDVDVQPQSPIFLFEEYAKQDNQANNNESLAHSYQKRMEEAMQVQDSSPVQNNNLTFQDGQLGKRSDQQSQQYQNVLSEQPSDFTIYTDRQRSVFTSTQKIWNTSVTQFFHTLQSDEKLLSQVIETQCNHLSHELSWLLLLTENEFEVAVNPYMREEDALHLFKGLFQKSQIVQKDQASVSFKSNLLAEADRVAESSTSYRGFASEPLFLVKWQCRVNTQATWEPISALSQPQNRQKVDEFLDMDHKPSMNQRVINQQLNIVLQQQQKLQEDIGSNLDEASQATLFNAQKEILDACIQTLLEQQEQSGKSNINSSDVENSLASHKISQLQKKNVAHLIAAFYNNKNIIICDQKDLGKRITLTYFLRVLFQRSILFGPVLIITQKSKLEKWKSLLDSLTKFRSLIYHDHGSDLEMEELRRWSLFYLDVTMKGNITTRNRLPKFNVLLTTQDKITDEKDPVIRQIVFTQVIVDDAHIHANLEATKQIFCKRIICSTSNPMQNGITDIIALVATVNPKTVCHPGLSQLSQNVTSLRGLHAIWSIVNPVARKNFHSDVEKLFGSMTQIELETPMTTSQIVLYKEIYRRYQDVLTQLDKLDHLSLSHQTELQEIGDLLLKTCNSAFLIDTEESLMQNYRQQSNSKRELTSLQKQGLVSGKMQVLQQLIAHISKGSKKAIICTHYDHMLILLKKVFKETGIGCFCYKAPMTIDSVYRFNLYSRPAVFLLQIGQTWSQEECSFFELDLIQNMIIFDQKGAIKSDLIQVFQVCQLPFTVNVNVYRLISQNSYEQRLYQRKICLHSLQKILFDNPENPWANFDQNLDTCTFQQPLKISTQEETVSQDSITMIPPRELDLLMRVSAEPIAVAPPSLVLMHGSWQLCLRQIFQNSLNGEVNFSQKNFETLIKQAKIYGATSNRNLVRDFYQMVTSFQESQACSTIQVNSTDYYAQILGAGTEVSSLELCCHSLCNEILLPMKQSSNNKPAASMNSTQKRQKNGGAMLLRHHQMEQQQESVRSPLNSFQQKEINAQIDGGKAQIPASQNNHSRSENMTAMKQMKQQCEHDRKIQSEDNKNQDAHSPVTGDMSEVRCAGQDANAYASEVIAQIKPIASNDNKVPVEEVGKIEKGPQSIDSQKIVSDTVSSHFWQLIPKLNQPDKFLPNGKLCNACFLFVENDLTREAIKQSGKRIYCCRGPCQRIFHERCILDKGLIQEGTVEKPQQANSSRRPVRGQNGLTEDEPKADEKQKKLQEDGFEMNSLKYVTFICKHCHVGEAQCFICHKYGPIDEEDTCAESKQKPRKMKARGGDADQDSTSGAAQSVKQCIVGPCLKFYHKMCLQDRFNVEFYTNSRSKSRFRCPLHYCVGCSISGNSVQILQCVACPTSYHLKCFRADRLAIKLTKKFILCGQHTDIISRIQQLNRKVHVRPAKRTPIIREINDKAALMQEEKEEAANLMTTIKIIGMQAAVPEETEGAFNASNPKDFAITVKPTNNIHIDQNETSNANIEGSPPKRSRDAKNFAKTNQKINGALKKLKNTNEE